MSNVTSISVQRSKPIISTVENITPEKAQEYLKTMVLNRKLNQNKVIALAVDMDADRWILTGQPVIFNEKGNMIDGQHRMEACILAKKPFITTVTRNVNDPRAFSAIDVGSGRTHADIFSIAGYSNANNCSAAAGILLHIKKGALVALPGPNTMDRPNARRLIKGSKFAKTSAKVTSASKDELLEFFKPYASRVQNAIRELENMRMQRLMPLSLASAAYTLFYDKSPQDAYSFMRAVANGEGLTMTDPAYVLRERLLENARTTKGKLSRWVILLLMIKAWNARRNNEKMRYLRIVEKEKFPKII